MEYQIIISNTTELLRVSALNILGIHAEGNYSSITMTDGEERLVSFQLGQLEKMFNDQLGNNASMLVRIGKSVIINMEYLYAIDLHKQELTLRSPMGRKKIVSASRDALRQLKAIFDNIVAKGGTK